MTYAISDMHGCYDKYTAILNKINFKDSDILYVLGDVVDRGENSMKILKDMMLRSNVFPLMGNHDYIAAVLLNKLSVEITADNYATHIDENMIEILTAWFSDGGKTTLDEFERLPPEEREFILEYFREFVPYEMITVNNKQFILTHSGLPESATVNNLESYDFQDFIYAKTDYGKIYFNDTFLITGHTPTFLISPEYENKIYRKNNHIAIDTGAVFGGVLSCFCLETEEEYYV
jgi:serine/threonine protein phosphatase 1